MKEMRVLIEDNLSYDIVKSLITNISDEEPKNKLTIVLTKEKLNKLLKEYKNDIIDEIISKIYNK